MENTEKYNIEQSPVIVPIYNSPMKILVKDYQYIYKGKIIVIKAGYAFDGLSIPRPCQWLVDMNGTENIKAWLEHDHLYSKITKDISTRKGADEHLFSVVDWSRLASEIIYRGVRIFWIRSYRKDSNYEKYKSRIIAYRKYLWLEESIA